MRIGHFPGLKGSDALLISCGKDEVDALRAVAREAVSTRLPVLVNDRCVISGTIPAGLQLFAAATGVLFPSWQTVSSGVSIPRCIHHSTGPWRRSSGHRVTSILTSMVMAQS
jgi:hypothetical protein